MTKLRQHSFIVRETMIAGVLGAAALLAVGCVLPRGGVAGNPVSNAGAIPAYLAGLHFDENLTPDRLIDQRLHCPVPAECGGQPDVHIRIVPERNSHRVHWQNVLNSGDGHVLAKIQVMEDVPFGPLKLDRRDTGYLWIGEIPSSNRNLGIFHIKDGVPQFVILAKSKRKCDGPPAPRPSIHLHKLPHCTTPFEEASGRRTQVAASSEFDFSSAMLHDQGLWQGCPQGCCETAFF